MEHREIMVADMIELKDGEMKHVTANGTKILLARIEGRYYAVGATCPHYGGTLAEGAIALLFGKQELAQLLIAELIRQRPGKLGCAGCLQVFVDDALAELQSASNLRL